MFKQRKRHIADFITEFEVLAINAETNGMYAILLLKKSVKSNILKTILGYLPIAALDSLKE